MQQSKENQSIPGSGRDFFRIRIAVICILIPTALLLVVIGSDRAMRLLYHGRQRVVTRHLVPTPEIRKVCTGESAMDDPAAVRIHCLCYEQAGDSGGLFPFW